MKSQHRMFSFAVLSVLFGVVLTTTQCTPVQKDPVLSIRVIPALVNVGEKVTISVEARDAEGALVSGSNIKLTSTLGSFDETSVVKEKSASTNPAGIAIFTWWAGDTAGRATITATNDLVPAGKAITVDVFGAIERVAEPEPVDAGEPVNETIVETVDTGPVDTQSATVAFKHTLSKPSLSADGQDTTTITTTITNPSVPGPILQGLSLKVKTSLGTLLDANTGQPLKPDPQTQEFLIPYSASAKGFAVTLQAGSQAGTATVEFAIDTPAYNGLSEAKIDINALGFIEFISVNPRIIGTQGSGKEVSTLTFKVLDINRKPFPAGTPVYFTISQTIGGASVSPSMKETDKNGEVQAQVKSGQIAATVTVTARVGSAPPTNASCPTSCTKNDDCTACGYQCLNRKCAKVLEATSSSVAIVGGRPNHAFMTFDCEQRNIGALYGMVGNNVTANINTKCSVRLGDRFTNKVGFATQVLFAVEAGAIDSTAQTIPFSTTGSTQNVGIASVLMRTQNPPPTDVLPMSVPNKKNCGNAACSKPDPAVYVPSKEPLAWRGYDCTAQFQDPRLFVEPFYQDANGQLRNPRDGLVSIIAYTNGEEEFTDLNGNGQYDKGEPFVDLGEPFLDVNDNGQHDPQLPGNSKGERFIDIPCTEEEVANQTNGCTKVGVGNGRRDGPNGKWDSNTLIWKKTWILWTGRNVILGAQVNIQPVVRLDKCKAEQFHSGIFPRIKFSVEPGKNAVYDMTIHDVNLNPLTPASSVKYTAAQIQLQQDPPSNGAGLADLGFTVITRKESLSADAQRVDDFIVHSSFFGLSAISHRLTLIDQDGTKAATPVPTKLDVVITSKATGVPTSYTDSFFIQGETY